MCYAEVVATKSGSINVIPSRIMPVLVWGSRFSRFSSTAAADMVGHNSEYIILRVNLFRKQNVIAAFIRYVFL